MAIVGNRAKETTQTTGTGTYSLNGVSSTAFLSLVAAAQEAAPHNPTGPWVVEYVVFDAAGLSFELCIGTLTDGSPDTLTRDLIVSSSNGNNAVNWPAGTKTVFLAKSAQTQNFHGSSVRFDTLTTQSINDAADTVVDAYDVEVMDRGGYWDVANPERFTIPVGGGIYMVKSSIAFSPNATGIRSIIHRKNGNPVPEANDEVAVDATSQGPTRLILVSGPIEMSANDRIDARVFQNSGGALNLVSPTRFDIWALE